MATSTPSITTATPTSTSSGALLTPSTTTSTTSAGASSTAATPPRSPSTSTSAPIPLPSQQPAPNTMSNSTSAPTATTSSTPSTKPPTNPPTNPPPPRFDFPREYNFPPFFTPQPNLTTRHSQLEKWSALILGYCAWHRLFRLTLPSVSSNYNHNTNNTNTSINTDDLLHNRRINRRLSPAHAREILEFMRKEGRAEYVNGSGGDDDAGGDVVWVYWRTPEEWASLLEAWVDGTAQKGMVLTLYELTEGEGTRGTEFHGLEPELLQKALHVLVKRGKAQIFGQEDHQGVKFF
ncbi:Uu.00g126480.m01.CDS01 [Anthostomella pinea]|uniref:ESCRT-II complex subunit VPS25 n=1 Tax=Anthostomella pinea TaxID=933095 RepID=A0AAI8VHW5_9PEZI|nr:Uu.00g126480.m01.CDS01 [Anthostomella pinea]